MKRDALPALRATLIKLLAIRLSGKAAKSLVIPVGRNYVSHFTFHISREQ
ncbi:MAG: hypothetical protein Q7T25_03555 [Sideroxyarcus sp.]|nr:hypothetical protein [Sideroxyarcus sp.]